MESEVLVDVKFFESRYPAGRNGVVWLVPEKLVAGKYLPVAEKLCTWIEAGFKEDYQITAVYPTVVWGPDKTFSLDSILISSVEGTRLIRYHFPGGISVNAGTLTLHLPNPVFKLYYDKVIPISEIGL